MGWLVLLILIFLIVGLLPYWPYSRKWGYYPSGVVIILVIVLVTLLAASQL